jgi:hypothetical protein
VPDQLVLQVLEALAEQRGRRRRERAAADRDSDRDERGAGDDLAGGLAEYELAPAAPLARARLAHEQR